VAVSSIDAAVNAVLEATRATIRQASAFRAKWRGTSSGLAIIRRLTESADDGETYAYLAGFTPDIDDEVLCLPVAGKPVVLGKIVRTAPDEYVLDVPVRFKAALRTGGSSPSVSPGSAAGTGATASVRSGSTDHSGQIQVVTGTSGVGAGTMATLTFSTARPSTSYDVWLQATSSAAQSAGYPRVTGRTVNGFDIVVTTSPGTSATLQWSYLVVET
jgi:hypothetical protein